MAGLLGSHVPHCHRGTCHEKKGSVHLRNFFIHEFAGGATGRWRERQVVSHAGGKAAKPDCTTHLVGSREESLRW